MHGFLLLHSGSKTVALVTPDCCMLNLCLLPPCLGFVLMLFKPLVTFISCDDCNISTDVQWLNGYVHAEETASIQHGLKWIWLVIPASMGLPTLRLDMMHEDHSVSRQSQSSV